MLYRIGKRPWKKRNIHPVQKLLSEPCGKVISREAKERTVIIQGDVAGKTDRPVREPSTW